VGFESRRRGLKFRSCIWTKSRHSEQMTDYIRNILCESTSPEPTEASTCTAEQEWSEDLMDNYSAEVTKLTHKQYSNINRAVVSCSGFEERAGDLLNELAMRLYADCYPGVFTIIPLMRCWLGGGQIRICVGIF